MEREFVYTKSRLRRILADVLERDVRDQPHYQTRAGVVEGFEKRATLEFLLWFLEDAFPENFHFRFRYEELESDYGEELARLVSEGPSWTSEEPATEEGGELIRVDFGRGIEGSRRGEQEGEAGDDAGADDDDEEPR